MLLMLAKKGTQHALLIYLSSAPLSQVGQLLNSYEVFKNISFQNTIEADRVTLYVASLRQTYHGVLVRLVKCIYHISSYSFRGNYSFLNLTLCTVTLGNSTYRCGNYSREETIQGRKLYEEIRYFDF